MTAPGCRQTTAGAADRGRWLQLARIDAARTSLIRHVVTPAITTTTAGRRRLWRPYRAWAAVRLRAPREQRTGEIAGHWATRVRPDTLSDHASNR